MIINQKQFDTHGSTYIMGILNITPDSFSDGGKWNTVDNALRHTERMIAEGMDIVDIGGESTRPGCEKISAQEEIDRVLPVVEAVHTRFDIPISVDTYKSAVAEQAIRAGAGMINDIWGLKYDPKMAKVISRSGAACCLMHNRETAVYQEFLKDVLDDLQDCIRLAKEAGIAEDRIVLDPGIGFAKTLEQNLQITSHLELLHSLGYPVLLGTSRKSMIGLTLGLPMEEREEGTMATTVLGVLKGCTFIRVHDVQKNRRVIDMTQAILRS